MIDFEKTFNEEYNFWVLRCPNGHMITEWNEGDPVEEFNAFSIAYCPKDADLSKYHCIEQARADELEAQKDKILDEQFKQEVEKIK